MKRIAIIIKKLRWVLDGKPIITISKNDIVRIDGRIIGVLTRSGVAGAYKHLATNSKIDAGQMVAYDESDPTGNIVKAAKPAPPPNVLIREDSTWQRPVK